MNNSHHKACFCDGSCSGTGICGFNNGWYGPTYNPPQYPGELDEIMKILKPEQTTTTIPKPTEAEELRRKADLADRDKRAKARAKNECIYNSIKHTLQEAATEGKYDYELSGMSIQALDIPDIEIFMEFLEEKGFYSQLTHVGSLMVDWKERIEVPSITFPKRSENLYRTPPTTEFLKSPPRRK